MTQNKYEVIRKIRDYLALDLDNSLKEDVSVILPANLSKTFLLNNRPDDVDEVFWLSGCYHIIHTITQLSFDKKYSNGKPGSYVRVYSDLLKIICGNSYKRIFIANLIELRIIECDGIYSKVKHESFGYRLTKRFRGQPYKNRTIKDSGIKNAILRHREEKLIELKERIRPIADVARWSIDKKLEINKEEAFEYLESYRYRMFKEIAKRNLKPKYREEEITFVNTRYFKAKYQVETWGNSPRITVDEAGGRLYTPVTSLMSPLRHFLTYNGESLVSFDLKNSQPLHFIMFLNPHFWKKGVSGWTLERLDKDIYDYYLSKEGTSPLIMFHRIAAMYAGKGLQFPNFRFLVKNGKLYEFICQRFFDKFQHTDNKIRFNTRNKTKGEVLKLMYFNPRERYSSSHPSFKEFKKIFPVEAAVMSLLKKRDYRDFSVLLQKIEARILLHEVCREVYDLSPDIPLFTVHDSIITTERYASVLEEVLLKKYTGILGFSPQLKREPLNSQAAEMERMKYVKSKIDQADIEVTQNQLITTGMFPFLKCEHWDIDIVIGKMIEPKLHDLGEIPRVPNIKIPKKYNR